LWTQTKDNVGVLTEAAPKHAPEGLRDFLDPVIVEMDPDEAPEEMFKVGLPNFKRCLRWASLICLRRDFLT
jgi:hypothetical protein